MIKRSFLLLALLIFPLFIFSQEQAQEEDETKMVREVITVQVDKSKFAPPPAPAPVEDNSKKKKKHQTEEPPPVVADTGSPMMPAPVSEISKRAGNWLNSKSTKYTKTNGASNGSTTSCLITFPYKQKTLNPENDVDGKITMDVIIEAKEGKYRYTIKNVKHVADKAGMSGGSIYENVPECGSMKCTDLTWKHIKSAAYADIQMVSDDLKAKMKEEGDQKKKDDW
jgi:hypothetical protein